MVTTTICVWLQSILQGLFEFPTYPGIFARLWSFSYFQLTGKTSSLSLINISCQCIPNVFVIITLRDRKTRYMKCITMTSCKTAVAPVLTHWSYCSLSLSHRYIHIESYYSIMCQKEPISFSISAMVIGLILLVVGLVQGVAMTSKHCPGPLFPKKTPSHWYRDSHYKPPMVVRPSQVNNGGSYTRKATSFLWIAAQNPITRIILLNR